MSARSFAFRATSRKRGGCCVEVTPLSTKRGLVRKLSGSIDCLGRVLRGPSTEWPAKKPILNERDVMTKLLTSLVFAIAAALAAPAMAASHAGGAPMKAAEPGAKASAPAKKAKKAKAMKKEEMKKEDTKK